MRYFPINSLSVSSTKVSQRYWSKFFSLFAVSFLIATSQAIALEHVTYPAFYPNVPSSANGETTYTWVWAADASGHIGPYLPSSPYDPGASDQIYANTTEETDVVGGNSTVREFEEAYYDLILYTCSDSGILSLLSTEFAHAAQWGIGTNGVFVYSPTDPTIYDIQNPPTGFEHFESNFWPQFPNGPECGTTTEHFQGTNPNGQVT